MSLINTACTPRGLIPSLTPLTLLALDSRLDTAGGLAGIAGNVRGRYAAWDVRLCGDSGPLLAQVG